MSPLHWFLVIVAIIVGGFVVLFRKVIDQITNTAADHAKAYALPYTKGAALIAIAMMTSFDETFRTLTSEVATTLPWWDWTRLFLKPLVAGLAVFAAFIDRSVQNAKEERAATTPPFHKPPIP